MGHLLHLMFWCDGDVMESDVFVGKFLGTKHSQCLVPKAPSGTMIYAHHRPSLCSRRSHLWWHRQNHLWRACTKACGKPRHPAHTDLWSYNICTISATTIMYMWNQWFSCPKHNQQQLKRHISNVVIGAFAKSQTLNQVINSLQHNRTVGINRLIWCGSQCNCKLLLQRKQNMHLLK